MTTITNREMIIKDVATGVGEVVKQYLYECTRTCLRCELFNEQSELCRKFNARPPARIIAYGCEHYQEPIPF